MQNIQFISFRFSYYHRIGTIGFGNIPLTVLFDSVDYNNLSSSIINSICEPKFSFTVNNVEGNRYNLKCITGSVAQGQFPLRETVNVNIQNPLVDVLYLELWDNTGTKIALATVPLSRLNLNNKILDEWVPFYPWMGVQGSGTGSNTSSGSFGGMCALAQASICRLHVIVRMEGTTSIIGPSPVVSGQPQPVMATQPQGLVTQQQQYLVQQPQQMLEVKQPFQAQAQQATGLGSIQSSGISSTDPFRRI